MAMNAADSPSIMAMRHIGQKFEEFDSDSAAMVVLEGDKPLGQDAHDFYDVLVKKFNEDTKHVEHVQDFWGDPLTAGGSQSKDGKAALVQVYLRGNQGEALSNESVDSIRNIVADTPAPHGVKAYVTGAAPTITDNFEVGNEGTHKVTAITFLVIAVMLLIVYRSLVTMLIMLVTVADRADGRPRRRRGAGSRRRHRPVDVCDESLDVAGDRGGHRLRDLPRRPLSGSPEQGLRTRSSRTTTCSAAPCTSSSARV